MNKDWKAKKIEIAEICKEYLALQERLDALAKGGIYSRIQIFKELNRIVICQLSS